MNRAELHPPSALLARDYAHHSCVTSMLGWQSRGAPFGDRAIALAKQFDDIWAKGSSCCHTGIGLHASARYVEGMHLLTTAISAFEKAGDQWELHLARFHLACCHFGLGNLADAVTEARSVFASSARIGDSRTMCSSWVWARATRGDIPFEQLRSCIPNRPDDVMSSVHAMLAEGYWHTFHERTAKALEIYELAANTVRTTQCVNSHTILVMPMLTMGLRLRADAVQSGDPQQAVALRKRAVSVAKWATRFTRVFAAAYPLALRERALILEACGRPKQALKFADRSCAVAEAQHAKYEHAQSLLVRGKIAQQLGRPEAEEQIRSATAALDDMEQAVHAAINEQSHAQSASKEKPRGY
jgi:two-component system sensor kinase